MRLEVINTGTELLLGNTVNTHLAFLGQHLLPLGLRIGRQLTIPDGAIIGDAVRETVGRADIVIVTGGLGPTSDDITRELIAELLGLPLELDHEVEKAIRALLWRRKREMSAAARRQAMVPAGATVLTNAWGTAPGLYVPPGPVASAGGALSPHLFLLPGPPRELHPMVREVMMPLLAEICEGRTVIREMRNFRLANIGESQVSAAVEEAILSLGEVELGYCARAGEVVVRVLGSPAQLAAAETIIAAAFPQQYFTAQDHPLEFTLVDLLVRLGQTVATAESCTGGLIAHRITNVPGASAIFPRGMVTYANEAKTELLGVPAALIAAHGAVSAEVCAAMAMGCLTEAGTDHALSVTGIAGPGGGSVEKPVGTVFVGLASRGVAEPVVEQHLFKVERETFKQLASQVALDLLRQRVSRMI
jgi:nicotinamide-nucleotide amidase